MAWLPIALVVFMCALALARNASVVRGLDWPAFDIQFREMAAAQTLLDDGFGPDSSYLGEHFWYNPLMPGLAAAGSQLSGVPLRRFIPLVGPWLNLIAPIAFFWMVAGLFDLWTGVAATAAFLFVTGTNLPFYFSATYSPWFAPENFGQGLFYVAVVLLHRSFTSPSSVWRDVALGALLGLIFLCHTAPALMVGGMLVVLTATDRASWRAFRPATLRLLRVLGVALIVSAPFLSQIVGVYHLRIVNINPSISPAGILDPNELRALATTLTRLPVIVAAAVAVGLVARRDQTAKLLLAWIAVSGGFIGYNYVRVLAENAGLTLPSIVPAFHFLFYSMAWVSVAFGVGIARAAGALARARGWRLEVVTLAAVLALVAIHVPSYLRRDDFTAIPQGAQRIAGGLPLEGYEWVRQHTTSTDVFLCTDTASVFLVTPAGRRVVATQRYFSNPFVDWAARDRDRSLMFRALREGDLAAFDRLASRYGVRYVIVPGTSLTWFDPRETRVARSEISRGALPEDRFTKRLQVGDAAIFEVRRSSQ